MWPPPDWTSEGHPDRSTEMDVSIPCENGQLSISARKTDSPPALGLGAFSGWEIMYTLSMGEINRTNTIGYVSTVERAISLLETYHDSVMAENCADEPLDALDIKARIDAHSQTAAPMIVDTENCWQKDTSL